MSRNRRRCTFSRCWATFKALVTFLFVALGIVCMVLMPDYRFYAAFLVSQALIVYFQLWRFTPCDRSRVDAIVEERIDEYIAAASRRRRAREKRSKSDRRREESSEETDGDASVQSSEQHHRAVSKSPRKGASHHDSKKYHNAAGSKRRASLLPYEEGSPLAYATPVRNAHHYRDAAPYGGGYTPATHLQAASPRRLVPQRPSCPPSPRCSPAFWAEPQVVAARAPSQALGYNSPFGSAQDHQTPKRCPSSRGALRVKSTASPRVLMHSDFVLEQDDYDDGQCDAYAVELGSSAGG